MRREAGRGAAIREIVARHLDEAAVNDRLVRTARTPSPQTDLLEAEPQVLAFNRQFVAGELRAMGYDALTFDAMGNLVCRIGRRRSERRLLLLGYAMNHPPRTMLEPYSGAVVDGVPYGLDGPCVWGRGTVEQKGAVAAVLSALELIGLVGRSVDGELIFAMSTAGECGRPHSVRMILTDDAVQANMGVLAVGTDNAVCLGNKGRVDLVITIRGRSSHVSTPWLGLNPIEGARQVLNRLAAYPLTSRHPLMGQATVTPHGITVIPNGEHTVPREVTLVVDRRVLPGEDPEAEARAMFEAIGSLPSYEVHYDLTLPQPPSEIPPHSEVARRLREAIAVETGREARLTYWDSALDAGTVNRLGVPALMYGPGDMRFAHTDIELVTIASVVEATRVYAHLALDYLMT